MRIAFRLAYDGSRYFGYVRQLGKTTVEGELLKSFRRCGLYSELRRSWYRVAARTDRGVSALGQVVALETLKEPDLEEINSNLPDDIVVLDAIEVNDEFDPRTQTVSKQYRYVCEKQQDFDVEKAKGAAKLLEGLHNFKFFCKREAGRPLVAELAYAGVQEGEYLKFDFIAQVFLRQQVRRMAAAILSVGTGKIDLEDIKNAIEGRAKHSFSPAPPEGLFLVRTKYKRIVFSPAGGAIEKFATHLRKNSDARSREMLDLLQKHV